MYGTCGRLLLISVIIFTFTFTISITSSSVARLSNVGSQRLPVLMFINGLPSHSEPWELRCGNNSINEYYSYLTAGAEDRWSIDENIGYSCDAMWSNQFAYWKVYEPGVDSGKATVFWLAKDDGLYHSWDRTNWTREFEWEHE